MTPSSEVQSHAEWAAALEVCQPEQRMGILKLAHPSCGIKMSSLEAGLREYLEPYLTTKLSYSGEMSSLSAPHHWQLLQVTHPCPSVHL